MKDVFAYAIIVLKQGLLSSQMMINDWRGGEGSASVYADGTVLAKRSLWGQKHFYIFAK